MHEGTKEVKSKTVKVGVATFNVYDAVTEAVEGLGEAKVLELVNAQVRTDAMNAVRGAATGKVSKSQLRMLAMGKMSTTEFAAATSGCDTDEERAAAIGVAIDKAVAEMEKQAALEAAEETATAPSSDAPEGEEVEEDEE